MSGATEDDKGACVCVCVRVHMLLRVFLTSLTLSRIQKTLKMLTCGDGVRVMVQMVIWW